MAGERIEIPLVIGGKDVFTGTTTPAVMPHDREHVLADVHQGGAEHVAQAIDAAARGVEGLVALAVGGARRPSSSARPSCSPARGATR